MCSRFKELSDSWQEAEEADLQYRKLIEEKKYLQGILFLIETDQISLAQVACADFGEKLPLSEKVAVMKAFIAADELDYARRFRYKHRLGAILSRSHPVILATSTNKREGR